MLGEKEGIVAPGLRYDPHAVRPVDDHAPPGAYADLRDRIAEPPVELAALVGLAESRRDERDRGGLFTLDELLEEGRGRLVGGDREHRHIDLLRELLDRRERAAAVYLGRFGVEEINPVPRHAPALDEVPENDPAHVDLVRRHSHDERALRLEKPAYAFLRRHREIAFQARDRHQGVERDEPAVGCNLEGIDLELFDRDGGCLLEGGKPPPEVREGGQGVDEPLGIDERRGRDARLAGDDRIEKGPLEGAPGALAVDGVGGRPDEERLLSSQTFRVDLGSHAAEPAEDDRSERRILSHGDEELVRHGVLARDLLGDHHARERRARLPRDALELVECGGEVLPRALDEFDSAEFGPVRHGGGDELANHFFPRHGVEVERAELPLARYERRARNAKAHEGEDFVDLMLEETAPSFVERLLQQILDPVHVRGGRPLHRTSILGSRYD